MDRSDELCRRALKVYERLYRTLEVGDPDLGANVIYVVGRTRLERHATGEPRVLPSGRADRIRELLDFADARDRRQCADLFFDFADSILAEVEHGTSNASSEPPGSGSRRAGDRVRVPPD